MIAAVASRGRGRATPRGERRVRLSHDERRAQIVASGRRLFSQRPGHAVSMEAVAAEAGVTTSLLYHYFEGRHDLYAAVVRDMFRGGPPVPEYVPGVTPEERLAESVDGWLEMVERNRDTWLAALGAEGLGHDPEIEEIFERVREKAVDNLIQVLGIGPVRDASPELRAVLRSFGGLAEAASREWLERDRLNRSQVQTLLTDALLALVRDVLPKVEETAPVPL
jgi:AcrR family transcriptional regulator